MSAKPWNTIKIPDDKIVRYRIGPLTLFMKKLMNEIWVASERDDQVDGKPQKIPDNPGWLRTALPESCDEFTFTPVFPDRSVVVDTEYTYRIFSGTRSRVYCRIPVFVQITPKNKPDLVVAEIPTVVLSGTWFGTFTEGEWCYALSSTVRRELTGKLFEPHLVICPIEIHNNGKQELKFEKIRLRTEWLSVYGKDGVMWADDTRITYQGKEGQSEIETTGRIPAEAKGGRLLSKPRSTLKKSIAERSFKLLREFTIPGF